MLIEIWNSHGGEFEDFVVLWYDTVQYGRSFPNVYRNVLYISSFRATISRTRNIFSVFELR